MAGEDTISRHVRTQAYRAGTDPGCHSCRPRSAQGQAVIVLEITFGFSEPIDEVAAVGDCRVVAEEQVVDLLPP
ncbi:hypothetical protein GKJPGBOP_08041 [Streptomyces paromomycinus]|uniref:Uncharacterized protein n=1 Tax=Streptomyces paromomycinus TaxID=92743 RepID=A0A401WFY4_STREY|nr:hypothetical protein GKJPGBOP_08041 [Streptomyces paromomycinus]